MSDTIRVTVLYFGATADVVGRRSQEIDVSPESPSQAAFEQVLKTYPNLATHKLLFSVNQQYSNGTEVLNEGDELAVFTAVSGG